MEDTKLKKLEEEKQQLQEKLFYVDRSICAENEIKFKEHAQHVMKNIEHFLVVAKHDRKTCSDTSPVNTDLCPRCTLLDAKASNYLDCYFEFKLSLHAR